MQPSLTRSHTSLWSSLKRWRCQIRATAEAASAPREQISDGDANCPGNQQCRERLFLDPARNGVGHPLTLGICLLADFSGLRSRLAGSVFNERTCIPNRGFGFVQNR